MRGSQSVLEIWKWELRDGQTIHVLTFSLLSVREFLFFFVRVFMFVLFLMMGDDDDDDEREPRSICGIEALAVSQRSPERACPARVNACALELESDLVLLRLGS